MVPTSAAAALDAAAAAVPDGTLTARGAPIVAPTAAPSGAPSAALKEWGAVAASLLDGRQTLLLRKGGIHEKAFGVRDARFVIFPTVAHSHAARVRPEHRDVLARGAADVAEGAVVVRCGATVVGVVEVARPERLAAVEDLHIWTSASVREDRVAFRPKHPLLALVVRAVELPAAVVVPRTDDHGGCRSWVAVDVPWDGVSGRVVHDDDRLRRDLERVRGFLA